MKPWSDDKLQLATRRLEKAWPMSAEGDRLLAEIVRFVREIEREEKKNPSGQITPSDGFDGRWLKRWQKMIARAEKYLANKPN